VKPQDMGRVLWSEWLDQRVIGTISRLLHGPSEPFSQRPLVLHRRNHVWVKNADKAVVLAILIALLGSVVCGYCGVEPTAPPSADVRPNDSALLQNIQPATGMEFRQGCVCCLGESNTIGCHSASKAMQPSNALVCQREGKTDNSSQKQKEGFNHWVLWTLIAMAAYFIYLSWPGAGFDLRIANA
jgi:hypothetical protein